MAVPMQSVKDNSVGTADYEEPEVLNFDFITDAGSKYLGTAIYRKGSPECLVHTSYELPFDAQISDNQNVREFMGLLYCT